MTAVTHRTRSVQAPSAAGPKSNPWRKAILGSALALPLAFGLAQSAQAVTGVDSAENIVLQWNDATLQAVRDTRMAPPIVARALAVVNTCAFDAWAAYDSKAIGTRHGRKLKAINRSSAAKREAIAYASYRAASDLFPGTAQQTYFKTLLREQGYDPANDTTDIKKPAGIGNIACASVLAFRHSDASNQRGDMNSGTPYSDWTGYQPVNTPDTIVDPNRWQPLRVPNGQGGYTEQKFLTPHWGHVSTFAVRDWNAQVIEPVRRQILNRTGRVGPANVDDPMYKEQAAAIVAASAVLTDHQKVTAEYWADGPASVTPPGHWMEIAQAVSARDGHTLDQDMKLMFLLANTLLDTSVTVWGAKVMFDSVRPVTAVRYLYENQTIDCWAGPGLGTQAMLGQYWQPYQALNFVTPPFGEYPSGHSAFSSSAAEVLKRFTGSDVFGWKVDHSKGSSFVEPGLVPGYPMSTSWATFTDAADDAGVSRRFGGIHFTDGDLDSRAFGRRVAMYTWRKARYHFGD